jgi:voltage-gated potassium channel Kch
MMSDVELQPTTDEALQAEQEPGPGAPVEVTVNGPVRTQELPRKAGGTRTRFGVTTSVIKLLSADHRRAQAVVIAVTNPIRIALSLASAQDISTMALWPVGVPYVLTADTELYVCASTGTADISVITEMWATGE